MRILLFIIALIVNLSTTTHSIGNLISDNTNELFYSNLAVENGWNWIETYAHNNTSVVIGWLIPSLSNLFNVTTVFVCKYIIPVIYSCTPVLLYTLYKRYVTSQKAFIGALFFILLPPSFLEVPTIAKTSIAEPVAVCTLLVLLSKHRWRIPVASVLVMVTLWCHYTIGFILLSWLALLLIYDNRRLLNSIPLITGSVFGYIYFSKASHGAITHALRWWQNTPEPHNDLVTDLILAQPIETVPILESTIATSTDYMIWIMRLVIYATIAVLLYGLYKAYQQSNVLRGYLPLIVGCCLIVTTAVFCPLFTRNLYLSRWIQVNSIPISILYAYGMDKAPVWLSCGLLMILPIISVV